MNKEQLEELHAYIIECGRDKDEAFRENNEALFFLGVAIRSAVAMPPEFYTKAREAERILKEQLENIHKIKE